MNPSNRLLWLLGAIVCLAILVAACISPPPPATEELLLPASGGTPSPDQPSATPAGDTQPLPVATSALPAPSPTPAEPLGTGGREIRLTPTLLPSLERVPVQEPSLVTGEVPTELLEAILRDAEARTGIEAAEMDLLRAEAIIWNDGSLGCPQPGVVYTQAPVDGYWVVLEAEGKELDYRAAQTGHFSLCEQALPPPGGAAAPTPEQ